MTKELIKSNSGAIHPLNIPDGSATENPPARQETWVRSLGWEDPLEEQMATGSRILAWEIPRRSLARTAVPGVAESQTRLSD